MAAILESFVGDYLLKKLSSITEDNVVMVVGVKDELDKLKSKMRHVASYLKDAERRRITDESVNNWLNELKDVMYEADDIIDLWIYKNQALPCDESSSSSKSPTCCSFPMFSCIRSIPVRHEVAHQIKTLNARLERIFKDMKDLNLQYVQGEVPRVITRVGANVTTPAALEIVGYEIIKGERKLVKMASMVNEKEFRLVAITGMGGIGKSTLANKIYNNQIIKDRYEIKIWLHVPQSYSPSQLIKEAIRNAGGNSGQAESEAELLFILENTILGKSVFLVLDDVWNPNLWVNLLQAPLKAHAIQGFILVTTRDQKIALQMGANHIHPATILSKKSGWELLCKTAYLTDAMDIADLKPIGIEIVKKCGGLPLAIKVVAGLLAKNGNTRREWEHVLNNNMWITQGLPDDINRALYLSYEDLSPHLKQCFLYCSLYPPGYYTNRFDLIRYWMAEGIFEESSDQIMEDIAEDYYSELIKRHLLEPHPLSTNHSRWKMHDLLRSLAQYLSKQESISVDQVLPDPKVISRLRHLSIKETNEQINISGAITEQLKLRTFIIFNCLSGIECNIFERLKNVRVLRINKKGLHNIPESIGDLIHLRLLNLDCTSISCLPESISSLTNLLIVSLCWCELLHALPRGMTRLWKLRHLKLIDTPLTFAPKGLGALQELTEVLGFQVLSDESQNGWNLQELQRLSQLRRISLCKLEKARNVPSDLFATKTHLKELQLYFSYALEKESEYMEELDMENCAEILEKLRPPPSVEVILINNYIGKMSPRWMSLPSSSRDILRNLHFLHLIGWKCCTVLPPLSLLPNLKFLTIEGASSIVRIGLEFLSITARNGADLPIAFPKLEYLKFIDLSNWEEWVLSDFERKESPFSKLMPRIKQLVIENCPKLKALPDGLQQLSAIEDIIISGTHSIKSINDLPFECGIIEVIDNKSLEIISNLPGVKQLTVIQVHNLRQVSKFDSVERIYLEDGTINDLPEWLIKLMEERKANLGYKLHLTLKCNKSLFKRCLKDGPDWPIIKCFSSVNVYNLDENAWTMEYTREPESYSTNLEEALVPRGHPGYFDVPGQRPKMVYCHITTHPLLEREIGQFQDTYVIDASHHEKHSLNSVRADVARALGWDIHFGLTHFKDSKYLLKFPPHNPRRELPQNAISSLNREGYMQYTWSPLVQGKHVHLEHKAWIDVINIPPFLWTLDELPKALSPFGVLLDHTPLVNVRSFEKFRALVAVRDLSCIPLNVVFFVAGVEYISPVHICSWIHEHTSFIVPPDTSPDEELRAATLLHILEKQQLQAHIARGGAPSADREGGTLSRVTQHKALFPAEANGKGMKDVASTLSPKRRSPDWAVVDLNVLWELLRKPGKSAREKEQLSSILKTTPRESWPEDGADLLLRLEASGMMLEQDEIPPWHGTTFYSRGTSQNAGPYAGNNKGEIGNLSAHVQAQKQNSSAQKEANISPARTRSPLPQPYISPSFLPNSSHSYPIDSPPMALLTQEERITHPRRVPH